MMKKYWLRIFAFILVGWMSSAFSGELQLGAGDVLKIAVYNHPDLALETRVSESGSISFPLVGEVRVGGISPADAEKKIASMLESGKFIPNAQVNIIVTNLQSQQVSILGQVNRPGRYPVDGQRSILDMAAVAGGMSPDAGDIVTLIRNRNGKSEKYVIDMVELLRSGDLKQNMEISAGDIVYVARAPRFYIYGEVQRPGSYRIERNMTVLQALSVGGGLSARGTERGVRLKRRNEAGELVEMTVNHGDIIRPDDIVFVRESLF